MKIGMLGTGMVGETLGTKFVQLGHQVKMGSRTANNETAAKWVAKNGANASAGTFADAAEFGDIAFLCLKGDIEMDVVRSVGAKPFGSTDIIDLGDITKSRATEMLLPIWLTLMQKLGHVHFGFKIVRP